MIVAKTLSGIGQSNNSLYEVCAGEIYISRLLLSLVTSSDITGPLGRVRLQC